MNPIEAANDAIRLAKLKGSRHHWFVPEEATIEYLESLALDLAGIWPEDPERANRHLGYIHGVIVAQYMVTMEELYV